MFLNGLLVNKQEIQQQDLINTKHVDDFLNAHQNKNQKVNKNNRPKPTIQSPEVFFNIEKRPDQYASKVITENNFKTQNPNINDHLDKIKAIKKNTQLNNDNIIYGRTVKSIKFC
jgi:5-methylcytosine-specific restriction endonuclease McrA